MGAWHCVDNGVVDRLYSYGNGRGGLFVGGVTVTVIRQYRIESQPIQRLTRPGEIRVCSGIALVAHGNGNGITTGKIHIAGVGEAVEGGIDIT